MQIGATLKIQIEGEKKLLTSEFMGVEEDKYLVIKAPSLQYMSHVSHLLYKGNTVIARYLHKGTVFGFKSRIKYVITNPIKLLILEYPKKIEIQNLRKHRRVDCYLPASVKISDNTIEGTIIDISREGCQFTVEKSKIESSLKLFQVEKETSVSFKLPGVEKILAVTGKQKYIIEDSDNVKIGVLFGNMAIEVQTKLFDFLSAAGA